MQFAQPYPLFWNSFRGRDINQNQHAVDSSSENPCMKRSVGSCPSFSWPYPGLAFSHLAAAPQILSYDLRAFPPGVGPISICSLVGFSSINLWYLSYAQIPKARLASNMYLVPFGIYRLGITPIYVRGKRHQHKFTSKKGLVKYILNVLALYYCLVDLCLNES